MALLDLDEALEQALAVGVQLVDHPTVEIAGLGLHLERPPQHLELARVLGRGLARDLLPQPLDARLDDLWVRDRGVQLLDRDRTAAPPLLEPLLEIVQMTLLLVAQGLEHPAPGLVLGLVHGLQIGPVHLALPSKSSAVLIASSRFIPTLRLLGHHILQAPGRAGSHPPLG